MKKVLFFDIDGTLLVPGEKKIREDIVEALKKIINEGNDVFIATGRCYMQAKNLIDQIGTKNYVCSNGQEVCINGKIIYQSFFSENDVDYLVDIFEKNDINWSYETRNNLVIPETKKTEEVKELLEGYEFYDLEIDPNYKNHNIFQFWLTITKEQEKILPLIEKNHQYYCWEDGLFEILPINENKANGIQKVIDFYNIPIETYAFGDSVNDLEMLKKVDYSIAMGNGRDDVKKIAKYVTTDAKDNGIINALKHYGILHD